MKKVEILRDTVVRFGKGSIVEVSDEEAARLAIFGNAKEAKPAAEPAPKKQAKKRS